MKHHVRLFSLLLAILVIAMTLPIYAFAWEQAPTASEEPSDSTVSTAAPQEITQPQATPLGPGEKTIDELKAMTLNTADVPEVLSVSKAIEKGHVHRLREQEDNLSTVTFQNSNGSKTSYVYSRPVKYIDENGEVKDKSTAITAELNRYAMLDNSVKAYFPHSITNGVEVAYDDYAVTMTPITDQIIPAPILEGNAVSYGKVFDASTILRYQTKQNGIKEDIVMVRDTGCYSYSFSVTVENLTPILINDIWYLINDQNRIVGDFGKVIVEDSAGNTAVGTMDITHVTANTYTLTVTAPQEFMQADTTVYPVYIDPSMTIYEEETYSYTNEEWETIWQNYAAIVDCGVYTTYDGWECASSNYGYHYLSPETGYVIYKMYDFYGEYGLFTNFKYYDIGNVTLNVISDYSTNMDYEVRAVTVPYLIDFPYEDEYTEPLMYDYNPDIAESYSSTVYSTGTLSGPAGVLQFDVTNVVKSWARYNDGDTSAANPSYGLIICPTSSSAEIYSTEASYAINEVYYVIDYSNESKIAYFNHQDSGLFFTAPETFSNVDANEATMQIYMSGDRQKWVFEYLGNNQHVIRSLANQQYAICIENSLGNIGIGLVPDNIPDSYIWTITPVAGGGAIYYNGLYNKVLYCNGKIPVGEDTTEYTLALATWTKPSNSNFTYVSSFTPVYEEWMDVGDTQYISINTGVSLNQLYDYIYFTFTSSNPTVATINECRIDAVGNGTTIITAIHKPTNVSTQFAITVGQIIPSNTYFYIKNKGVGRYLDVEGPSTAENANIQVWDWHGGDQSKWTFTYNGNGYYYIHSVYSNLNMTVGNGNSIQQTQSGTLWKITATPSGAMKLTPMQSGNINLCMGLPSTSSQNGDNCELISYTNNNLYNDEWFIIDTGKFVNLIVKVDGAYRDRYNITDLEDSFYQSRVSKMLSIVKEKLMAYFNIHIEYTIDFDFYSLSDTCDVDKLEFCCEQHTGANKHTTDHTNVYNVLNDYYSRVPINKDSALLVFTGHKLCVEKTGETTPIHYNGAVYNDYAPSIPGFDNVNTGTCDMVLITCSRTEIKNETKTLLHEIGHLFDAKDHYDYPIEEDDKDSVFTLNEIKNEYPQYSHLFSDNCIYGVNKEDDDVVNNLIICDGCYAMISDFRRNEEN